MAYVKGCLVGTECGRPFFAVIPSGFNARIGDKVRIEGEEEITREVLTETALFSVYETEYQMMLMVATIDNKPLKIIGRYMYQEFEWKEEEEDE